MCARMAGEEHFVPAVAGVVGLVHDIHDHAVDAGGVCGDVGHQLLVVADPLGGVGLHGGVLGVVVDDDVHVVAGQNLQGAMLSGLQCMANGGEAGMGMQDVRTSGSHQQPAACAPDACSQHDAARSPDRAQVLVYMHRTVWLLQRG